MTSDPLDRERRGIAWLLVAQSAVVTGLEFTSAVMAFGATTLAAQGYKDTQDWTRWGVPSLLGLSQLLFAVVVLVAVGVQIAAAFRTLNGHLVPLRGPAMMGVVAAAFVLPSSFLGCNWCGLALWPLPLGMALSTLIVAFRAPDPRQAD